MPAKLSLQARLINLLSELDDAGVEAVRSDLFLGARGGGTAAI